MNKIDELSVKSIRFLAAETVEKAKSGHPGLAIDAAPMAYTLVTSSNGEPSSNSSGDMNRELPHMRPISFTAGARR